MECTTLLLSQLNKLQYCTHGILTVLFCLHSRVVCLMLFFDKPNHFHTTEIRWRHKTSFIWAKSNILIMLFFPLCKKQNKNKNISANINNQTNTFALLIHFLLQNPVWNKKKEESLQLNVVNAASTTAHLAGRIIRVIRETRKNKHTHILWFT